MIKNMKKIKKIMAQSCFLFLITISAVLPCQTVCAGNSVAKNTSAEWYIENEHACISIRWKRNYGLLAQNVKSAEIATCSGSNSSAVFISQRNGEYRSIDFSEKYTRLDENGIFYKNDLVAKGALSFHPADTTALFLTKGENELLFTGDIPFKPFAKKKVGEYCEEYVSKDVGGCWHDEGMLACIRGSALRIYDDEETKRTYYKKKFFEGKANRICKVVSCVDHSWHQKSFFVLMKDGTVWGMGDNSYHTISDSDKKYYSEFVKLGVKNVRDICAAGRNVGVIKKDGSLWVWGQKRSGKNGRKKKFTVTPWCISKGVQSFSMSPSGVYNSILLFVKQNKAYGWGSARRFALPQKAKDNWHNDRPVLLKSNIKQVYAAANMTLLLDNDGNLYWRGCAEDAVDLSWVEKHLNKQKG